MDRYFGRLFKRLGLDSVPRVKRVIVAVIGATVLLLGVALIFLPGPAIVVIPAGLAILATEFAWAKRWLDRAKGWAAKGMNARKKKTPRVGP